MKKLLLVLALLCSPVFALGIGTSGSAGGGGSSSPVGTKNTPVPLNTSTATTITTGQTNTIWTDAGCTGAPSTRPANLPVAVVGLSYSFSVTNLGIRIVPFQSSDVILYLGGSCNGYIDSTTIGSFITLYCSVANQWQTAYSSGGAWGLGLNTAVIQSGLLVEYRFDDGAGYPGVTETDHSGNGNNGTIVNGSFSAAGMNCAPGNALIQMPLAVSAQMASIQVACSINQSNALVNGVNGGGGDQNYGNLYDTDAGTGNYAGLQLGNFERSTFTDSKTLCETSYAVSGNHLISSVNEGTSGKLRIYFGGIETPGYKISTGGVLGPHAGYAPITASTDFNLCNGYYGVIYYTTIYNRVLSPTEVSQNSAYITSVMAGRTITLNTNTYAGKSPLVYVGDSITQGFGTTAPFPTVVKATINAIVSPTNVAVNGLGLTDENPSLAGCVDTLFPKFTGLKGTCCIFIGTNDINAGYTGPQVFARLQQCCQNRRAAGWQICVLTCLPRGAVTIKAFTSLAAAGGTATVVTSTSHGFSSSDSVTMEAANTAFNGVFTITVINATTFTYPLAGTIGSAGDAGSVVKNNQFELDRILYNTAIRNNMAGSNPMADVLYDVGADTTIGLAGQQTNGTYYQGDNIHPSTAGHVIIAAGVVTALGVLGLN